MKPLNLQEYQAAARAVLPPAVYGIVAAGSDDEVTLQANRAAFDQWRLLPRMWRGYSRADLRTTVLGQEIAMPVLLAPVATHTLVHPQGEAASAAAARRAGTIFTLGTCASATIEVVAKVAGPWWFQLYFFPDRAIALDLIQRAEACGARPGRARGCTHRRSARPDRAGLLPLSRARIRTGAGAWRRTAGF